MPQTVVIVGNGVSGITAARHIRKRSNARIVVIGSESDHFYSRTALMYVYMGHMRYEHTKPYEDWFWSKNRIELVRSVAIRADTESRTVLLENGETIAYDSLVIATGSKSNVPPWPGVELQGVTGLYGLRDLDVMESLTPSTDRAVVVGGGLIGIELAEMLVSRGIEVVFLVREESYMDYLLPQAESNLVNDSIRAHGVDLRLGTELSRIVGDSDGRAAEVETADGRRIESQFVGLAVGVHPNIDFANSSGVKTQKGVLVNEYYETDTPAVYAIGDCAEFANPSVGQRAIEQLWYSGRRHGATVARTIVGMRTANDPGVFYNSAKFFDLEYQTYGHVPTRDDDEIGSFVFAGGQTGGLVRVSFERRTGSVCGFNVMGVRFRQAQCEQWIREGSNVSAVTQSLKEASFDPEFSKTFERLAAQPQESIAS